MSKVFKKIKLLIFLILVLGVFNMNAPIFVFADEMESESKNDKYFVLMNRLTETISIVNEDGKKIISTNYNYTDHVRSELGVLRESETNEIYFYKRIIDYKYTVYEEEAEGPYDVYDTIYDIYDKKGNLVYKDAILEKDKYNDSYIKLIYEKDESDNKIQKIFYVHHDDWTSFIGEKIVEYENDCIKVFKNTNNNYDFISKKYDYAFNDIDLVLKSKLAHNSTIYILQKKIDDKYIFYYISKDGKILANSTSNNYIVFNGMRDHLYFVDDKYIIYIDEDINIFEYGDDDNINFINKEANSLTFSINYKKDSHIISKITASGDDSKHKVKIVDINNKYYIVLSSGESFGIDGKPAPHIKYYNDEIISCEEKNSISLYNEKIGLIEDDLVNLIIKEYTIHDIDEVGYYKNLYIINTKNGLKIIDAKGDMKINNVSDIDAISIEYFGNNSVYNNEYNKKYYHNRLLIVKMNEGKGIYNHNGELIADLSDNITDIYRAGNYALIKEGDCFKIYSKNTVILDNILDSEVYADPSWMSSGGPLKLYNGYHFHWVLDNNYYEYDDESVYGFTDIISDAFFEAKDINYLKGIKIIHINQDLLVYRNGLYSLYDENGKVLLKDYKYLCKYNDEYLYYENGFNYGLVDRNGNIKFSLSLFEELND